MKHHIIPSLMAVTLLFGGAVPAFANHDKTPAEMQEKIDKKFEKLDINRDGKISESEFDSKKEAKFANADANGDGSISKEEMSEYKMKKWEEHKK